MEQESIIDLRHINIYQKNILILSDVNVRINKGEFVYIIGKTGSGKSTLLKILYCEIPVIEGDGRVCDFGLANIKNRQIPYLRRKLGIIFQDFQLLFDRTVNENLLFVMRATGWKDKVRMKSKLDEVLTKVGLETKGFKMPHQLSGGEQQRVVIARALVNDPDIILADEPTGNLDPETSEGIMKILFDISRTGRAVIMATHNYSILQKFPSRIIKCENSRLYEESDLVVI